MLAELLWLLAYLVTRFAFSRRMARLFAVVIATVQQRTTYRTTRHFLLRTPDVLDGWVLAACTRFGGQVRARRANVRFVAGVRRLGMATTGWRPMTRVGALDDSSTA
jgi:hypothetical protein